MKVIDEKLLGEFRGWLCEWCGLREWSVPHHLWARGMGGGGRLDVRINLISLCAFCHNDVHAGLIQRCDLLAVVAARERTTQGRIEAEIYRLRRTPKELLR